MIKNIEYLTYRELLELVQDNIDSELLEQIYNCTLIRNSNYWIIFAYIAQNPNTPVQILEKLSYSLDIEIIISITKNPNIPIEFFSRLVNADNPEVRLEIVTNSNCPKNILIDCLKDPELIVRREALKILMKKHLKQNFI